MPGLTPRRVSGRLLRLSARAQQVPVLGASVRAASKGLLPLDELRDARLGQVRPYLAPPVEAPEPEPLP